MRRRVITVLAIALSVSAGAGSGIADASISIEQDDNGTGYAETIAYCYNKDWRDPYGRLAGSLGYVFRIWPTVGYSDQQVAYKVQYDYQISDFPPTRKTVTLTNWQYLTTPGTGRVIVDIKKHIRYAHRDVHNLRLSIAWRVDGTWRYLKFLYHTEFIFGGRAFEQYDQGIYLGRVEYCLA